MFQVIPDVEGLTAPLGMGVGFLARFGDICSSVVDGISEGINFGFNSYWVAWQGYYGENEAPHAKCGSIGPIRPLIFPCRATHENF